MKRQREDELAEEIEGIKSKIEILEASLTKWEAKAEKAESDGQEEKAEEHWKDYRLINTQLASLLNILDKTKGELLEERHQKREKGSPSSSESSSPGKLSLMYPF